MEFFVSEVNIFFILERHTTSRAGKVGNTSAHGLPVLLVEGDGNRLNNPVSGIIPIIEWH